MKLLHAIQWKLQSISILLSMYRQIGDFGMARDLINESVYVASGGRIPVKWTALEVSA